MNVHELMEILKEQDPTAEVHIELPTHDHWNNYTLEPVLAAMDMGMRESTYHYNKLIVDEDSQHTVFALSARYL